MLKTYELIGTVSGHDGQEYKYHSYILAENIDEATKRANEMSNLRQPLSTKFNEVKLYVEKK